MRNISTPACWTRILTGVCLMAIPLLTSCRAEEDEHIQGVTPDMGEYSNLTLLLNVNGDPALKTRADSDNPMGGENGNGLRQGEHHENDIDNLCVFAFNDEGMSGVAGLSDETPVKYCRYIDGIDFHPTYVNSFENDVISTEVKVTFEGRVVGRTDAFLVVANMGDLTSSVSTLSDIRDALVSKTLDRPAADDAPLADCTHFTMANAHNSRHLGGIGTKDNPYLVSIDLERTTARVDFWYAPTLSSTNKPANLPSTSLLGYKVTDRYDESLQTGWMYISHIKLMNVPQYTPYVLKRLAASESDPVEYLIDEQHVGDEAAKYVLEPYTWLKGTFGGVTYPTIYGNTFIQNVATNYQTIFTQREAVRNYTTPQNYSNGADGFNFGWSKDWISGEAYYVIDYVNENTVEQEHTNGYNTTSMLLKAKFVPKELRYKSGSVLSIREALYGETFWAMEIYDGTKREKLYFATKDAADFYAEQNPTLYTAQPVEYSNGDNYYTIWIRHDNNSDNAHIGKMEYAIVRNNIYRIGVSKVLGPGSPTPQAKENPEDVNLHIYVRNWNYMSVPTINI